MRAITYTSANTAQEAFRTFVETGDGARYIAGGTNLYDLMKLGIDMPAHLIDISTIAGLDAIETDGQILRFGAGALMADVAAHPVIREEYPVLAEALTTAASQQLRNMATVGGNLLQRTRCMYFRNGAGGVYPCNKRNPGSGCPAIGGQDRGQAVLGTSNACTAVSPGDWPVALDALDASIEIEGQTGRRNMPITALYRLPGATPHMEFNLAPGEIITAILVPKANATASTYHKIRDRASYAFALASAAVVLEMNGSIVRRARVALGGVATIPWRAVETEIALEGQPLSRALALQAGQAAFAQAQAGRHNVFKIRLGAQVIAAALMIAVQRASQ